MLESEIAEIISIRSPVKRETRFFTYPLTMARYFNPLPRKEGDSKFR